MRYPSILLLSFVLGLLLSQCGITDRFDDVDASLSEIPESSKELGVCVANKINNAILFFHRNEINFSDGTNVASRDQFYEKFALVYPELQSRSSQKTLVSYRVTPEEFAKGMKELTDIQISFINRIIQNCYQCNSYNEFYRVIEAINKDIKAMVPKHQQLRLYNVTAVLYYGFREIQNLESQGVMALTPTRRFSRVPILSRSEESGETFGATCRKILATVWTIAVGEPTPAGEIVASVASVLYAGVFLYEVWLCVSNSNENEEGETGNQSEIYHYCQERYLKCLTPIPDGCSICLQFCLVQGYWPPYETHKCS